MAHYGNYIQWLWLQIFSPFRLSHIHGSISFVVTNNHCFIHSIHHFHYSGLIIIGHSCFIEYERYILKIFTKIFLFPMFYAQSTQKTKVCFGFPNWLPTGCPHVIFETLCMRLSQPFNKNYGNLPFYCQDTSKIHLDHFKELPTGFENIWCYYTCPITLVLPFDMFL